MNHHHHTQRGEVNQVDRLTALGVPVHPPEQAHPYLPCHHHLTQRGESQTSNAQQQQEVVLYHQEHSKQHHHQPRENDCPTQREEVDQGVDGRGWELPALGRGWEISALGQSCLTQRGEVDQGIAGRGCNLTAPEQPCLTKRGEEKEAYSAHEDLRQHELPAPRQSCLSLVFHREERKTRE